MSTQRFLLTFCCEGHLTLAKTIFHELSTTASPLLLTHTTICSRPFPRTQHNYLVRKKFSYLNIHIDVHIIYTSALLHHLQCSVLLCTQKELLLRLTELLPCVMPLSSAMSAPEEAIEEPRKRLDWKEEPSRSSCATATGTIVLSMRL